MTETVLVALGGNALVGQTESGQFDQQVANASGIAAAVADMVSSGTRVVVTHGNGPQVGNVMLQNDAEAGQSMPLFACGAESQGLVGAALALAFENAFRRADLDTRIVPMLTPVVVDETDLDDATKPVGPFYSEAQARRRDGEFREDAGRGWRRVVPSPDPVAVRNAEHVTDILDRADVPIAAGGGGLPIVPGQDGFEYVDGVVDKDLAAAMLAVETGVDRLVILTDVAEVYLDYGGPDERALEEVDLATARDYQAAGHFERGSMYEKVEAICRFLEATEDGEGIIASLDDVEAALAGRAGTVFTASEPLIDAEPTEVPDPDAGN